MATALAIGAICALALAGLVGMWAGEKDRNDYIGLVLFTAFVACAVGALSLGLWHMHQRDVRFHDHLCQDYKQSEYC